MLFNLSLRKIVPQFSILFMELIIKLAELIKALLLEHIIERLLVFHQTLPLQILEESHLSIELHELVVRFHHLCLHLASVFGQSVEMSEE